MKKIIALIAILALLGTQVGAVEPNENFEAPQTEQTEMREMPLEEAPVQENEEEKEPEEKNVAEETAEENPKEENGEEVTEEVFGEVTEETEEEEIAEETAEEEASNEEVSKEEVSKEEKTEFTDGGDVRVKKIAANAVSVTVPADGATFEFEDLYPDLAVWTSNHTRTVSDPLASGGEYLQCGYLGAEYAGTYPGTFTVEASGTYTVKFRCNLVGYNMSKIKFKIDDNEFVDNYRTSGKNYTATSISMVDMSQPGAEYLYDFITEMELSAGEHTMSLSIEGWENVGNGRNAYAFDCLSIYKPKEITSVRAEADDAYVCGDVITPVMYNQDDKEISLQDYDSIEYTTTTPEILSIDGGKITAINHGTGKIKITVKVGDEEYTDTKTVSVAAKNGLYIKWVKREGTKITATLAAVGDYDGKSTLIAVGYNVENGLKTCLADSATGKIEAAAKGEEKTVELTLDDLTADMYINLFMYSGNTTDKFAVSAAVYDVK